MVINQASTSLTEIRVSRTVLMLTFNAMLVMTGFGIVFPVIGKFLFSSELGGTAWDLGIIGASYSLTAAIFSPIAGKYIDQIGRKAIILFSMVGFGLSNLLYLFAESVEHLIIIRAIEGVFVAGLIPAALSIITDVTSEKERGKWIGIFFSGFYLGFVIGPLLGGVAYDNFGFASAFILSAILAFLAGFLTYFIIKETKKSSTKEEKKSGVSIISVFKTNSFTWIFLFFILIWISFFVSFAWLFVEPGVVEYVYNELGRTATDFGMIVAVYGAMLITGQLIFGRLADKVSRHGLILTGMVIYGLGFLILIGDDSYLSFLIFALSAGLSLSLISPSLNSLLTFMTDESNRGVLLGISSAFANLSGLFGPILGGFLYDEISSNSSSGSALNSLFIISIAGIVFSMGLVLLRVYLTARDSKNLIALRTQDPSINPEFQFISPLEFPSSVRVQTSIQRAWTQLTAVAFNDRTISKDEKSLLIQIMSDLQKYSEVLSHALGDGIITEEESKMLKTARNDLWFKARGIAMEDTKISQEEQDILQKLTEILSDLEIKENSY